MAADPVQLGRDEARFESLYREYAGDVYRYALAIMRNPSDAEDVTQTTFLNAWRAYSAGEEPRAPLNWFIAIAHNVCRLRFRSNARRPREVEFEPALAEAPAVEGPSASVVLAALAELPLNQRAAIVMRELEGRSYADIADVLGVSRSAVETLIFRARRSLRIQREAIRSLALLPLPSSLMSFLRVRGPVETAAGAALGTGVAAKAVAVIAAGVFAAGAAHKTVLDDRAAARDMTRPTPARSLPTPALAAPMASALDTDRQLAVAKVRAAARADRPAPPAAPAPRQSSSRVQPIEEAAPSPAPAAAEPPAPAPPPRQPPQRPSSEEPQPGRTEPAAPAAAAPPARPKLPSLPLPALPLPELPPVPQVPQLPQVPPVSIPPVLPEGAPLVPPVDVPQVAIPLDLPPIEAPVLPDVLPLP
jgi:RNA polymerase sigma factor (sigma-70 family)